MYVVTEQNRCTHFGDAPLFPVTESVRPTTATRSQAPRNKYYCHRTTPALYRWRGQTNML